MKVKRVLGITGWILVCVAVLPAEDVPVTRYAVRPGDTLFGISRTFHIPLEVLLSSNPTVDERRLKPGQELLLPGVYEVQKGDTLYSLSRRWNVPLEALKEVNGLTSNVIKAGDFLYLPVEGVPVLRNEDSREQETPGGESPSPVVYAAGGTWPHPGERSPLEGRVRGVSIRASMGDPVISVTGGRIIWVGPYGSFGKVVMVEFRGYIYVYGGLEEVQVSPGQMVSTGTNLGTAGKTPLGNPVSVFFFVYRDGQPVDPERAPRANS
ncbi:M23 family metallopeptidase [Spirochaeta thermophila]|uniref:M23 family metallopeptidase n=1 Tax=Winmispira thermophila TaxID=154 RepID=UPI000311D1C6|nr:M23 family metallopeptidase [Spirochaeta thermophila]